MLINDRICCQRLYSYLVVRPIPIQAADIAPAFGEPGGGIQYKLPMSVQELLDGGYLNGLKGD